jgi:hypothetical protein
MSRIGFVGQACSGGSCKSDKGFAVKFANNEPVDINDYFDLSSVEKKKCYLSPKWSEFVSSQFESDEQIDGYPKANGLRRVAELLLGDIIDSSPTEVFPVHGNGAGRASVSYSITFMWHDKAKRTYADVADVSEDNIDSDFLKFSLATASTRAECRALRKALKLKKCAYEELDKKQGSQDEDTSDRPTSSAVSTSQIRLLNTKCADLDIDLIKFINSGEEKYDVIEQLSKVDATTFIKKLTHVKKNPTEIDPTWRN